MALYQHQPQQQSSVAALFVVGYGIAAYFAYSTAGLPLAAALAEQARLEALANATNDTNATANLTASSADAVVPDTKAQHSSSAFDWEDEEVRRSLPVHLRLCCHTRPCSRCGITTTAAARRWEKMANWRSCAQSTARWHPIQLPTRPTRPTQPTRPSASRTEGPRQSLIRLRGCR